MQKAADALLAAAIKTVEELEGLVSMLGAFGEEGASPRRISLASELREIASLFDKLPMLENDLRVIKRRFRGMLSSDPEKTPRAVSVRDFVAVQPHADARYEAVEDQERQISKPPLPKRTPP